MKKQTYNNLELSRDNWRCGTILLLAIVVFLIVLGFLIANTGKKYKEELRKMEQMIEQMVECDEVPYVYDPKQEYSCKEIESMFEKNIFPIEPKIYYDECGQGSSKFFNKDQGEWKNIWAEYYYEKYYYGECGVLEE